MPTTYAPTLSVERSGPSTVSPSMSRAPVSCPSASQVAHPLCSTLSAPWMKFPPHAPVSGEPIITGPVVSVTFTEPRTALEQSENAVRLSAADRAVEGRAFGEQLAVLTDVRRAEDPPARQDAPRLTRRDP